ncbi:MAG: hypothetical protein OXF02_04240 [Simkaniaceae bacterium]|nr:hypothetical protein [Simkaniaceae bacterium]
MVRSVALDMWAVRSGVSDSRLPSHGRGRNEQGFHQRSFLARVDFLARVEQVWDLSDQIGNIVGQIRDLEERVRGFEKQTGETGRGDHERNTMIERQVCRCMEQAGDLHGQEVKLRKLRRELEGHLMKNFDRRRNHPDGQISIIRGPGKEISDHLERTGRFEMRESNHIKQLRDIDQQHFRLAERAQDLDRNRVAIVERVGKLAEDREGRGNLERQLRDIELQKVGYVKSSRAVFKRRIGLIRKLRDDNGRIFGCIKQLRNLERQEGDRMEAMGLHAGRVVKDYTDRVADLEKRRFDCVGRCLDLEERISHHMERAGYYENRTHRIARGGFRSRLIEGLKRSMNRHGNRKDPGEECQCHLKRGYALLEEKEIALKQLWAIDGQRRDCEREIRDIGRREIRKSYPAEPDNDAMGSHAM